MVQRNAFHAISEHSSLAYWTACMLALGVILGVLRFADTWVHELTGKGNKKGDSNDGQTQNTDHFG